ncbi:hypothetical protein C0J52_28463, partial [Blattella germanica]
TLFAIEERIGVDRARLRELRYDAERADYIRRSQKPDPTNVTIHQLVNKFNSTVSVHDDTRSGRSSVPEGTVQRIQEAIERSTSASTRHLSHELELPQSTSRCINMRNIFNSCTILRLKIILHVKQCATILFKQQKIKI